MVLGVLVGGGIVWSIKRSPSAPQASPDDTLFALAPLPLARLDASERVIRASESFARALGVETASALTGRPVAEFFHPDDLAPTRGRLRNLLDGDGDAFTTTLRLFRADGALIHTRFSAQRGDQERTPGSLLIALEDLTQAVTAQAELSGARAAMSALYQLMAGDRSRDFDAKMRAVLEMGCSRFDLPIGTLSRFHDDGEGNDLLETLFVQSPDRRVRPALALTRDDAETREGHLLGLHLMGRSATLTNVPFLEARTPTAFLGAPIIINGAAFGMVSFASSEARELPFEGEETDLLQLMAEWVGGEIEREQARLELQARQDELVKANEKLETLATHDPLTEAKNRRAFNDKLAEEWSRAQRYGTALSLVLLDVDKFKLFNDQFGHPAGDEVLKKVALIIMASVRGTDFFARYGGEEFALILPNTDAEGAIILAERLRERVAEANWKDRAITASFGITTLTPAMRKAEELTSRADEALYKSKERGRNRVTHTREFEADETTEPTA